MAGQRSSHTDSTTTGTLVILRLFPNLTVAHETRITNGEGGLPAGALVANGGFGQACATSIRDVDGDGLNDIAVGALTSSITNTNDGALYILFMRGDDTVRNFTRLSQAVGEGFDRLPVAVSFLGDSIAALPPRDPGNNPVDIVVSAIGSNTVALAPLGSNGTLSAAPRRFWTDTGRLPIGTFNGRFGR